MELASLLAAFMFAVVPSDAVADESKLEVHIVISGLPPTLASGAKIVVFAENGGYEVLVANADGVAAGTITLPDHDTNVHASIVALPHNDTTIRGASPALNLRTQLSHFTWVHAVHHVTRSQHHIDMQLTVLPAVCATLSLHTPDGLPVPLESAFMRFGVSVVSLGRRGLPEITIPNVPCDSESIVWVAVFDKTRLDQRLFQCRIDPTRLDAQGRADPVEIPAQNLTATIRMELACRRPNGELANCTNICYVLSPADRSFVSVVTMRREHDRRPDGSRIPVTAFPTQVVGSCDLPAGEYTILPVDWALGDGIAEAAELLTDASTDTSGLMKVRVGSGEAKVLTMEPLAAQRVQGPNGARLTTRLAAVAKVPDGAQVAE